MPSREDYGTPSSTTLVPAGLTVFRHFRLDGHALAPMSYMPGHPSARAFGGPRHPEVYAAGRMDYMSDDPFAIRPQTYEADCLKHPLHEPPVESCSCGFYASYDPDTDFYPLQRWGPDYLRHTHGPDWPGVGSVVVRAVAEVTGRVLMGRLGVRAAKMTIKAIAIDWSKYVIPTTPRLQPPGEDDFHYRVFLPTGEAVGIAAEERADAEAKTRAAAAAYGVEYFDAVGDMREAYPMADISALGVDTSEPEFEGVDLSGYVSQMQVYGKQLQYTARTMADSFRNFTVALNGAFGPDFMRLSLGLPDPSPKAGPVHGPMTRYEALLEAKRNRPAPPGSGIDRRRGRVR